MNILDPQGRPDPATPPAPVAEAGAPEASLAPDVQPDSSSATTDVDTADSSPADGVTPRQAMLEVTRSALALTNPTETPAPPAGKGLTSEASDTSTPKTPEPEAAPDDADDEFKDTTTLDFGKHPRFQKLLKQWNRDRGAADSHRQVETFMQQNGLSPTEAANALKLAALLRHAQQGSVDHAALFLKDLMPQVAKLRQLVGEEIAPDVLERVNDGAVDEPTAKELTQARAKAEAANEANRLRQEQEQDRIRAASQDRMRDAVSQWEADIRTKDDAYPRKMKLVTAAAVALARETPPTTAQEAVALAKAAYQQVTEAFDGLVPAGSANAATPPLRPSQASTQRTVIAKPRTPLEVTKAALAAMNQ